MHQKSGLNASFRATKREDWSQACLLLFYTLVGGLAPLWIGWPLAMFYNQDTTLSDFARNGEFAIYCAAVIAPSIYLIVHERAARLGGQAFLVLISLMFLAMAIVFYVFVLPVPGAKPFAEGMDKNLYARWTAGLFFLGAAFVFILTALDNARVSFDIRQIRSEDENELRDQFTKLEE